MMTPVIAIVGRPNVGKSTLFNYLTRSRDALVADQPGVTRDRQYGEGSFDDVLFIAIDTGGIENKNTKTSNLQALMLEQTAKALEEANIIFWVVDARSGLTPEDRFIADHLRILKKSVSPEKLVYLLINKSDGMTRDEANADFYELGWQHMFLIAATQGIGISEVLQTALAGYASTAVKEEEQPGIKVAIIGRPNAGKSTLVNRILGEERVLVYDAPGTTRDSIFIPIRRRGKDYVIIDTAGVRRRRSIKQELEKFSVVKTLQAITESNVVVFVIDAKEGIENQDLHLLGYVLEAGKALVIAVNKWDGLPEAERAQVRKELNRRLTFVSYARVHYISAKYGSGLKEVFASVNEAYLSATRKLSTPKLTEILERAVQSHQPPLVQNRRIKLRYAHPGGTNPPVVVIHGNQTQSVPGSYKRYLANYYREALHLVGTPLVIVLKSGVNPFQKEA